MFVGREFDNVFLSRSEYFRLQLYHKINLLIGICTAGDYERFGQTYCLFDPEYGGQYFPPEL
jgi:hypothetical protein